MLCKLIFLPHTFQTLSDTAVGRKRKPGNKTLKRISLTQEKPS